MKRAVFFLAITLLLVASSSAQATIDSIYNYQELNKSLRFAQLTLGGDVLCASGGRSTMQGSERSFGMGMQPRFTIGGLHFWGHTDFYVTFPLGINFQQKTDFSTRLRHTEGVETGMKIYPWALRPGRLRPYIGFGFQPFSFRYKAKGNETEHGAAIFERFIAPPQAGVTYATRHYLFTAGLRVYTKRSFNYYELPTQQAQIDMQPFGFTLGILRYMDTDVGMGTPRGVQQQNIMYHILKENKRLDAWYWGIGPSAALQMSKSSLLKQKYPYLANTSLSSFLMPDLTFGRYFSKPDLHVGFTARPMFFKVRAFDAQLRMQRLTAGIEACKFLFDYHGFVPFAGPMVSVEYLNLEENGIQTAKKLQPSIGIAFGWDIRLTQTGTSLLRTNLRYVPGLNLKTDEGEKVMFDHLEFNFIQYVTFIGRKKLYRKYASSAARAK
ncbi:MAG: hypothetical protein JNM22_16045 [Saprospiraceae bacterium]|nr:hypothetical protein [Saprospiraceae bacterium]